MKRRIPMFAKQLLLAFLLLQLCGGAQKTNAQVAGLPDAPNRPVGSSPRNINSVTPEQRPYQPLTGEQRIRWAVTQTFRPQSWFMGAMTAGIGTAADRPTEYRTHWDGFGKRYGMRFSGVAASNTIEAGLGALWGEDPRYAPKPGQGFKRRFANVFVGSVMARNRQGKFMPAYARYVAIPGNNFLSNTWRVGGEADTGSALIRTGYGILAEVSSNAWTELWPDIKHKVLKWGQPEER